MRSNRPSCIRPVLVGLALGFALGEVGCSDASRQSGTRVTVQESDQQAMLKSAEARKKRMQEKSNLPKSKQGGFD